MKNEMKVTCYYRKTDSTVIIEWKRKYNIYVGNDMKMKIKIMAGKG